MRIDKAVLRAVERGYSVHILMENDLEEKSINLTYKLMKNGDSVGRGFRIRDYEDNPDCEVFTGSIGFVAESILMFLEKEKTFDA